MNDRRTATNGLHLLRAVKGCFQTSVRCGWRNEESGSAFENSMRARMKAEAYYAMPMARI